MQNEKYESYFLLKRNLIFVHSHCEENKKMKISLNMNYRIQS